MARDPILSTFLGAPGSDHLLPSFDPERFADDARFTAASLADLESIEPNDEIDRIAKAVITERLETRRDLESSGETARTFGAITSPLMDVRESVELQPNGSAEARAALAARLRSVPAALMSWRQTLDDLASRGELPARRHVEGVAAQAATFAEGAFAALVARLGDPDKGMADSAAVADAACGELALHLRDQVLPRANGPEACGRERYTLWLRDANGADLDLDELHAWGWADLCRINERMWELAGELLPGAVRIRDVAVALDADDSRATVGTDALLDRLESFTAATVAELDGVHFDIDPRIRRCEARLAPDGSAAAPYYRPPSEDFSRPGSTWFPTLGRERFSWWRTASMWYHESVPGHHLQVGTALCNVDRLSRFQRTLLGMSAGHVEGWALYAERLMEELGAFTDPGDEFGFLFCQALRAARIVVDLGLHLGFTAPEDLVELEGYGDCGGQKWSPELAIALLEERAIVDTEFARSEVDRYLAIPAQATAYKVGERVWLASREEARKRLGTRFSLKEFHAHALGLGSMGLDPFRAELARWDGS